MCYRQVLCQLNKQLSAPPLKGIEKNVSNERKSIAALQARPCGISNKWEKDKIYRKGGSKEWKNKSKTIRKYTSA